MANLPSVPFHFFCSLCIAIGQIKPRTTKEGPADASKIHAVIVDWIQRTRQQAPALDTGAVFFRLLFPDTDIRRRYGMQETFLAAELVKAYQMSSSAAKQIRSWNHHGGASRSCLGHELSRYLVARRINKDAKPSLTLHQVDALLDELAAHSSFSNLEQGRLGLPCPHPRSQTSILRELFLDLSPSQAAVMAQIILKDLTPLLYPLPAARAHTALIHYNTTAFYRIECQEVLALWHWALRPLSLVRSLDDACLLADEPTEEARQAVRRLCHPVVGQLVQIPKAEKSYQGVQGVVSYYHKAGVQALCVETKYDGERMQIHVNTLLPYPEQIRIYSKSKRDSTQDRQATHSIIRCALGMPVEPSPADVRLLDRARHAPPSKHNIRSIIIEAEMVCYNERTAQTDEFWRIFNLKNGIQTNSSQEVPSDYSTENSQQSYTRYKSRIQAAAGLDKRHFKLVFFDVLELNGTSHLCKPFQERRKLLEEVVRSIEGFSSCVEQTVLSMQDPRAAEQRLDALFRQACNACEEGLFLKPLQSFYNGFKRQHRWTKLKKDYIPGQGDTCSFVILGASHDKRRGRDLGVGVSTFTTFYAAALTNKMDILRDPSETPSYRILFPVSYGLSRKELDDLNYFIKGMVVCERAAFKSKVFDYDFVLPSDLESNPTHLFSVPMVFDIYGAGWTKPNGSAVYSLRHPRISNIYRHSRPLSEAVSLEECQEIALQSPNNCTTKSLQADGAADASALWESFALSTCIAPIETLLPTDTQQRLLLTESRDPNRRAPSLPTARSTSTLARDSTNNGARKPPRHRETSSDNVRSRKTTVKATPICATAPQKDVLSPSPRPRVTLHALHPSPLPRKTRTRLADQLSCIVATSAFPSISPAIKAACALKTLEDVLRTAGWVKTDGSRPPLSQRQRKRGVIYLHCDPAGEAAAVKELVKMVRRSFWNPLIGRHASKRIDIYRVPHTHMGSSKRRSDWLRAL